MTLENYAYRTDPMFLRNQFPGDSKYGIPTIPKTTPVLSDYADLRFIAFNQVGRDQGKHSDRVVHFFLYDYEFEKLWKDPESVIEVLKPYRAVLTPDFSMYLEMPAALQLYNTFRNRWCGAYLAQKGLAVIPTVNWGDENSFDFCFEGIPKGSIVAVSTYMVSAHGNHSDQKEYFLRGYEEMVRRIEPDCILCYHEPFPEMKGNIITISYESSSWQSLREDKTIDFDTRSGIMVKKAGFVQSFLEQKGSGSAHGGSWRPSPNKPDDARFLGEPGDINSGEKSGYRYETKIGDDGRATMERHYTDHNQPWAHTNPHDHQIIWDKNAGFPRVQGPINYPDGAPEFKHYSRKEIKMENRGDKSVQEQLQFASISDFKDSLVRGGEVEFQWKGIVYNISRHQDNGFAISHSRDQKTEKIYFSPDELLEHLVSGDRLRNVIKQVDVRDRMV